MTEKRRKGRPPKHGGYSVIGRDELIQKTGFLRRYLEETRAGLVKDIGGTEDGLSEQQRVMIDRIISRLSILRLMEVYIEKAGPVHLKGGVVSLQPPLIKSYLAYCNSIDRALVALGLEKREREDVLMPWQIVEQEDKAKQKEAEIKST